MTSWIRESTRKTGSKRFYVSNSEIQILKSQRLVPTSLLRDMKETCLNQFNKNKKIKKKRLSLISFSVTVLDFLLQVSCTSVLFYFMNHLMFYSVGSVKFLQLLVCGDTQHALLYKPKQCFLQFNAHVKFSNCEMFGRLMLVV